MQQYNLRISKLLNFPAVKCLKFRTNTFGLRGTYLWNQVPESIKIEPNAKCSEGKITTSWQLI